MSSSRRRRHRHLSLMLQLSWSLRHLRPCFSSASTSTSSAAASISASIVQTNSSTFSPHAARALSSKPLVSCSYRLCCSALHLRTPGILGFGSPPSLRRTAMRSKHTAAWSDTSLLSAPPASGNTISSSCHRPRSPPVSTPLSRIDHCTAPPTTALRVAAASLSSSIGIMRTILPPPASSPPASSLQPTNSAHSLSPAPSALALLACDTLRRLFTSPSTIAAQPDSATSRRVSSCAANLASSWHPCHATKFNTDLSVR